MQSQATIEAPDGEVVSRCWSNAKGVVAEVYDGIQTITAVHKRTGRVLMRYDGTEKEVRAMYHMLIGTYKPEAYRRLFSRDQRRRGERALEALGRAARALDGTA